VVTIAARFSLTVFFFQAEDGIRDFHVTGVQTCALPISEARVDLERGSVGRLPVAGYQLPVVGYDRLSRWSGCPFIYPYLGPYPQIGRASCRERVSVAVVGV